MVNHLRRLSIVGLVLCLAMLAGCGGKSHRITSIVVTPGSASIAAGLTQQFTATAHHADGTTTDVTATVTWTSGTTAVATIAAGGLAKAVAVGSSQITAAQANVTSSPATLTVTAPNLVSITISSNPSPATVAATQTVQFTATGTYSDNSQKDLTATVTWNSGTMTVATINAAGLATAVGAGMSSITATSGAITSNAITMTVTGGVSLVSITIAPATPTIAVGQTVTFVATGHYSDGTTQVLANATWQSATAGTASILSPSGIAVALAVGSSNITASFGGITSSPDLLTVAAAVARAMYTTGSSDGNLAIFALNAGTAALYPIGTGSVGHSPLDLVLEPSGRYAYLLQGDRVTAYSVNSITGGLAGVTAAAGESNPVSTATSGGNGAGSNDFGVVDPTGRFLYVVSNAGTTDLNGYTILADGTLSQGSQIQLGTGLSPMVSVICDRAGQFLYAIDQNDSLIYAYSIDQNTGALTALSPTASFATGTAPQYPAIDPSNTRLYVPNSGAGNVSVYTINHANGSLTAVPGSPFSTGAGTAPTYAAIDASGKYFYTGDIANNTVIGLAINADGSLGTALANSPYAAGGGPVGIAIDPTNSAMAVANINGNTISSYAINPATGALTPALLPQVESSASATFVAFELGLASLSVKPGAVYAANSGSGDISSFTSTAGTGVLTAATNSPFAGTAGNSVAAASLDGSLLITGSPTQVAAYAINPSTGAVSASGSPQTVTGPVAIGEVLVSPTDGFAVELDQSTGNVLQYPLSPALGSASAPVASFTGASALASDPQGDFVFVLGTNATNGILPMTTYIPGQTVAASSQSTPYPGNWNSGAVDGSGQYLVAADSTAKMLQSFSMVPAGSGSGNDGSVTSIGSVGLTGTGPWVVAFDPQDRAVFVADQGAGTITPFAFDPSTGTIGAAGTATGAIATGITNITTDITGSYLYAGVNAAAAPGSKGAVAVYSIGAGGALTAVAGSPFTAGTGNPGVAATNVVQ